MTQPIPLCDVVGGALKDDPIPFVVVGIDPGQKTGIATYTISGGLKIWEKTFWQTIRWLDRHIIAPHREKKIGCIIVMEAPQNNSFIYARHVKNTNVSTQMRIAMKVGMNQRDGQLLYEYITHHQINCTLRTPSRRDAKWDAKYFQSLSGIRTTVAQEHCRDAARFISPYWVGKLKI